MAGHLQSPAAEQAGPRLTLSWDRLERLDLCMGTYHHNEATTSIVRVRGLIVPQRE